MAQTYDRLRHLNVPLTPEERVRQWFILVLEKECGVPLALMNSEVSFKLGQKQFRADILVWDRNAVPVMVVECKRPDVPLNSVVADQAVRYDMALGGLKWIVLTNGKSTAVLRREGGSYIPYDKLPSYDEIISD